jgi:alpha-glucoside transport system substrate-binding protein
MELYIAQFKRRRKMNKFRNVLALVMLASLFLAACGSQATPTEAPPPATQPPATQPPATSAPTEAPTQGNASGIDCAGAQSGDTISMLYQWSGEEEGRLNQILKPLVDACGITLKPESTRDQGLLDTRVKAGTPPDIAFWNVTQLVQYKDQLKTMDSLGASNDAYIPGATGPGTIDGKWLGLPVKTDLKTIIWYSPANFEAAGYQVPTSWDELDALVEKMVADGKVPWSMGFQSPGGSTGWTGTDFIQDIMLVQQGPDYVNKIISGDVPYNDAGVQQAYETYAKWATDPKYTVGGAQGTLSTDFNDAILKVFSDPPEAMMVKQSGFAAGTITTQYPDFKQGTDFDFFVVPGAKGLQGGSDWMMSFSDKPAVKALVAYLSSVEGAKNWAAAGFGLSPNKAAAGNFTDPALQKLGEAFYATSGLTPDIGDSIPGGFDTAEWKAVVDVVNGADIATELATAAAVQKTALGK